MATFSLVNYSLRTNKSIQRSLVFEGARLLKAGLKLSRIGYAGFGSLWFTDFLTAHKTLGIREMYSMEIDKIGFARAKFNRPFHTIDVRHGNCSELLPKFLASTEGAARPWLIWLDYDKGLDEEIVDDLRRVVEDAPENSILVVTTNCKGLGRPNGRVTRLKSLLGGVVPDELSTDQCQDDKIADTLLTILTDFLTSSAAGIARAGGFLPAFRIAYQDGTPMITFGGMLPSKQNAEVAKKIVGSRAWTGIVSRPIALPPLTLREAAILQAQLPRNRPLRKADIRALGFDLETEHVRSFEKFYRYYPFFAQISV
jgi:hypothetical protein